MTKKTAADGEAEAPKRKKAPTKKPAAKKPVAAAKKPPAKKPAKVGATKKKAVEQPVEPVAPQVDEDIDDELDAIEAEAAQAVEAAEIAEVADLDEEDIEDAQIVAETVVRRVDGEGVVVADVDVDVDVAVLAGEGDESTVDDAAPLAPALSEEERELATLYGDDLSAPATAHAEYQDRQTADEDRPMMPEINARDERRAQWQDRRDRRRSRREQRDRERQERRDQRSQSGAGGAGERGADRAAAERGGGDRAAFAGERGADRTGERGAGRTFAERGGGDRAAFAGDRGADRAGGGDRAPFAGDRGRLPEGTRAPVTAAPAPVTNGHDHDALARVGTPLGDAAATVFAQLRNGQPLPVRQLAAMMRKRSLVELDPEQLAPQLKAELLGDERSYRTLGLRPRIVYRGRDLFAPGPVAMSQTADAEANVASALSRLAGATHRALSQRIARATAAGFERLIHAYLVAAGYRDIAWVKRIGGISYASAIAPGIDRTILLSARSGDQPIDRRGIGELRVGVEAKNLVAGILFSARELSEDAERELERAGRSIAVICGDQLVATLIASGVGVVSAAAPLHYVDDQLLDELLAG
ncbi:MAG: restriction endonuclease [Deltaproteobacteria bacterium]|nr:restriction endonuclease [Deltaproteobacteria bacterium]